jgi:choline transport protein
MEKRIDLQTFGDDHLRARGKDSMSESKGQEFDRDRYELARVGKEQVLKVRFTFADGVPGSDRLSVGSVWYR